MFLPFLLIMGIIFSCNIMDSFINSVFLGAVEAKGGLFAILFRWITNGLPTFGKALLWSLLIFLLIYLNKIISFFYPEKKSKNSSDRICILLFILICIIGIPLIMAKQEMGSYFAMQKLFDVTILFMLTIILLIVCFYLTIKDWIHKHKNHKSSGDCHIFRQL